MCKIQGSGQGRLLEEASFELSFEGYNDKEWTKRKAFSAKISRHLRILSTIPGFGVDFRLLL